MGVLNGKAVIITGSGRGIGAACAKCAAGEGAAVVVNDINGAAADETVEAIRTRGGHAVACVADVARWEDAERLIRCCIETFGKLDGLVNNAGLAHIARIQDLDPKATRSLVEVNVIGPLYCTAHAVKPMLAQGSGSIVNVISGAHMGLPGLGTYAASKGAVASMVYSWAIELAGSGVRVNAVSPVAGGTGMSPDDPLNQTAAANSPVVEFLLSDLSADVNGQLVRIEGQELHLYTHPALLLPPALRPKWSAQTVADAFAHEFKERQVGCGVMGMECLPIKVQTGYWTRNPASVDPAVAPAKA